MRDGPLRVIGALAGAWAAAVAPAGEGVPRVLLDRSLESRPVRLVSISTSAMTYIDPRGLVRTEGLDQYVALLPASDGSPADAAGPPASGAPAPAGGMVELADGRRFAGAPTGKAGDEASLEWKSPEFGVLEVPLEQVRRVWFRAPGGAAGPGAGSAPAGAGARDSLVLANGDILEGFVASIGDPTRIEHDSTPVDVPLERIAEVRLGGAPIAPSGIMVWLRDGTAALVSSLSTGRGGEVAIGLTPMNGSEGGTGLGRVPLDQLVGAAFDVAHLVPLGTIAPVRQEGAPERVYAEPLRVGAAPGAVLGAPDIEFPGPMSATWVLPAGASRLGGVASLPEDCRTWGDCELVMTVASGPGPGREVLRVRLNGAAPRAEFSVPLGGEPGAVLTATVEAGEYGPIQDRVVLERAVVLVETEGAAGPGPVR